MCTAIDFTSYRQSVFALLSHLKADRKIPKKGTIVLKPNLINDSPPPITTPVQCCRAIVEFIRSCSQADILIAEGCGQPSLDTQTVFTRLGYAELAHKLRVQLVDLNTAGLVRIKNPAGRVFEHMYLPKVAVYSYLISVPVLKAHSLAGITGALKNMIGLAPPEYYSGRGGTWKKAALHTDIQEAILDLVSCKAPDLSVMDASIGLAEYHLGGAHCDPPVGKLIGGFDPWKVDRMGARLLKIDWRKIKHLYDRSDPV